MDALLSLLPGGTLTAIIGAVIAALAIIWHAVVTGKRLERGRRAEEELAAIREKKEVENEVDNLGPADVDKRFERYRR